jgi:hypothetical protein
MNNEALNYEEIQTAVRMGIARGIAHCGITPEMAEKKLANDVGQVPSTLSLLGSALNSYVLYATLGGAAIGGATGLARHELEKRLSGEDDPEISALEKKRQGYEKMTQSLKDNIAATAPAYTQPRVQDAMR